MEDTARLGGTNAGAAPPGVLPGNAKESVVPGVMGDSGMVGMVPVLVRDPPDPPVEVRLGTNVPLSSLLTLRTGSRGGLTGIPAPPMGVLVVSG